MRKTLSIVLISSMALLLSTGCSSTKADTGVGEAGSSHGSAVETTSSFKTKFRSSTKACDLAKEVGEKQGWKMTEFKPNEIFAEKRVNDKTIFTTIKFFEGVITFSNLNGAEDLFDTLKEESNKKKSSH